MAHPNLLNLVSTKPFITRLQRYLFNHMMCHTQPTTSSDKLYIFSANRRRCKWKIALRLWQRFLIHSVRLQYRRARLESDKHWNAYRGERLIQSFCSQCSLKWLEKLLSMNWNQIRQVVGVIIDQNHHQNVLKSIFRTISLSEICHAKFSSEVFFILASLPMNSHSWN